MSLDRENVLRKIAGLLAMTVENGCSEEEATTAAQKAQSLLTQYKLEMSEVVEANAPLEEIVEEHINIEDIYNKLDRDWIRILAASCAKVCYCVAMLKHDKYHEEDSTPKIVFFGKPADIFTCKSMFSYLVFIVEQQLTSPSIFIEAFGGAPPTFNDLFQFKKSFRFGMADRIADRLEADSAKAQQANVKITDIVRADVALATNYMKEHYNPKEGHLNINVQSLQGFLFGQDVGSKISLQPTGELETPAKGLPQ